MHGDPQEHGEEEFTAARERALHIAWLYRVAQTALVRAREYRREEGKVGFRERECLAAVTLHRAHIRRLRSAPMGPGLRKTEHADQADSTRTGTSG